MTYNLRDRDSAARQHERCPVGGRVATAHTTMAVVAAHVPTVDCLRKARDGLLQAVQMDIVRVCLHVAVHPRTNSRTHGIVVALCGITHRSSLASSLGQALVTCLPGIDGLPQGLTSNNLFSGVLRTRELKSHH